MMRTFSVLALLIGLSACVPAPKPTPSSTSSPPIVEALICQNSDAEYRKVNPQDAIKAAGFIPVFPTELLVDTDPRPSLFVSECSATEFSQHLVYRPDYRHTVPPQTPYLITITETVGAAPGLSESGRSLVQGVDVAYEYDYLPAGTAVFDQGIGVRAAFTHNGLSYLVHLWWYDRFNSGRYMTEAERTQACMDIVSSLILAAG